MRVRMPSGSEYDVPDGTDISQYEGAKPVTAVKAHTRSIRSFFQPSPDEQRQADVAGEAFTKNAANLMSDPGVIGGLATIPFGGEGVPLALARVGVGAGASALAAKARGEDPGRAALVSGGLGTAGELATLGLNALAEQLTKQWLRLTGKGATEAPKLARTVLDARQVLRGAGDLPKEMVAARGASAAATRGMIREAKAAGTTVPLDEMLRQVEARAQQLRTAGDPGNELPGLEAFVNRMRTGTPATETSAGVAALPADVPVDQAHIIKRVTQRGGSARFDRFAGTSTNPELQKMVAQDTRAAIGSRVPGYNAQDATTRQAQLGVEAVQKAQGAAEAGAGVRGAGLRRLTAASVGGLAGLTHGQGPGGALALLMLEHLSENPYLANRMALTFTDPRFHALARAFPHLAQSAVPAQ